MNMDALETIMYLLTGLFFFVGVLALIIEHWPKDDV